MQNKIRLALCSNSIRLCLKNAQVQKEVDQFPCDEKCLGIDSDKIHSLYPELSLHQAILIDCYIVQRSLGIQAMKEAMNELSKC